MDSLGDKGRRFSMLERGGFFYIWCQRLWAFWLCFLDAVCVEGGGLVLVLYKLFFLSFFFSGKLFVIVANAAAAVSCLIRFYRYIYVADKSGEECQF